MAEIDARLQAARREEKEELACLIICEEALERRRHLDAAEVVMPVPGVAQTRMPLRAREPVDELLVCKDPFYLAERRRRTDASLGSPLRDS